MKNFLTIFILLSGYIVLYCQPATIYNLSLTAAPTSPTGFVDVELNLSFDVAKGLGTSNFFIDIDQTKIGVPTIQSSVFASPYVAPTITNPAVNRISLNIELPVGSTGFSIPNAGSTKVATLRFPILVSNSTTDIIPNSTFIEIFTDDDDFLSPGVVTGLMNFALPIHLSYFSATKHTERSSKLNWKTSSEINSDYFGIERSKDGNTWETIGRVTAAGNSSRELAYEFIDDKLPLIRSKEQVFYYRLRMTDLDGQYKYSDVRGVNFGKLSEGVVTIYPNPTVEHINVDLSGMDLDAGAVDLFVYDMTGRQVIKKSIIGNGIELIDVSLLPASTYNVVVKQGETAYQQRVIKID